MFKAVLLLFTAVYTKLAPSPTSGKFSLAISPLSHRRHARVADVGYHIQLDSRPHSDRATALSTEPSPQPSTASSLSVKPFFKPQHSQLQSYTPMEGTLLATTQPYTDTNHFPGSIVPAHACHPGMMLWWHLKSGTKCDFLKNTKSLPVQHTVNIQVSHTPCWSRGLQPSSLAYRQAYRGGKRSWWAERWQLESKGIIFPLCPPLVKPDL